MLHLKSILEQIATKKRLNLEELDADNFLEFLSVLDDNDVSYTIDYNENKKPVGVVCYGDKNVESLYEKFKGELDG